MKRERKIQRHPSGRYYVRIMRDGVSKCFPLGKTKKDARIRLAEINKDVAAGRIVFVEQDTTALSNPEGDMDMRVEELAVLHLEWVKANRAIRTFELRQSYVLRFLDFVGPIMVAEITRMTLERYHAHEKQKGKGPNSGNHALREAKTLLLWGVEMEIIDLSFKRFPTVRHTPPETKRIAETDLKLLLQKVPSDFRDMLMFALVTGLRPGELRELKVGQIVQGQDGQVHLCIQRHKTSRTIGEPRPRTVPLCRLAQEIVNRQIASHPKLDHVFLNGDGNPYERSAFRNRLIRWCRKVGVRATTPYALRHTFASMQSDQGTETTSLSALMGHSQTRTLERYVSNTHESHRRAVDGVGHRLGKLLG
jgi:integrase